MGIDNIRERASKDFATEVSSVDKSSVALVVLFTFSSKFFKSIGVYDLTICDLSRPDPIRVKRLLSAVVNFMRFREKISVDLEPLAIEAENTVKGVRDLQDEATRLATLISETTAKIQYGPEGKRHDIQYVHNYNKKLEAKLRNLKGEQERLTRQHEEYKCEKNVLAERLRDVTFLCDEAQAHIEQMKGLLNTDIGVLTKIIEDLRSEAETRERECTLFQQQYQNIGKTIDSVQVCKVKMREITNLAEELRTVFQMHGSEGVKLMKARDHMHQLQHDSDELQNQIEISQSQLEKMSRKYEDLIVQQEKRQVALQKRLDEAKTFLDETFASQSHQRDVQQITMNEIAQLQRDTEQMSEAFEKMVKTNQHKLTHLNEAIKQYMEGLRNK
ncbi:NUF2 [Candida oxycetoniae]|uniref:NUF2 n=1 Tax=Candida oxycetoniae TaxID=497107 RepID=A0AAI9WZ02_9ASCO|nr:NUF2 [Candida oxycetoniae]KAI3405857.1 NUF2 [Candida oxycetoniae]